MEGTLAKTTRTQEARDRSREIGDLSVSSLIEGLKSLDRGWNGYGAEPIDPMIIGAARWFADSILGGEISPPQVVPMTRGRLQLEWHRGNRSLELEFESPTSIRYLQYDSDRGVEEEDITSPDDTARLMGLLRWFSAE